MSESKARESVNNPYIGMREIGSEDSAFDIFWFRLIVFVHAFRTRYLRNGASREC